MPKKILTLFFAFVFAVVVTLVGWAAATVAVAFAVILLNMILIGAFLFGLWLIAYTLFSGFWQNRI